MQTSKDREKAFRADLNVLLTKHGATLEVATDYDTGHDFVNVMMLGKYNGYNIQVAEYTEFKL